MIENKEKEVEKEEIIRLFEERRYGDLLRKIAPLPPADAAEIFEEVPKEHRTKFFRLLPKDTASELFIHMDSDTQEHIISTATDRELAEMLGELYLDDTVDLIEEMPANVVNRILRNSTTADRKKINELLKYPANTAGSIMTTEFVSLKKDMTVKEAFSAIRAAWVFTISVPAKRKPGTVLPKPLSMRWASPAISSI